MTAFSEALKVTTVARRELDQRWAVLGAAAALGLIPVVASAFAPGLRAHARMLGVTEFFVAQAIASFVGLGLVGDDLASGRMGWYFSRPLSGFAIWAGKLGGAALLAIAATLVMALPALLLAPAPEAPSFATPLGDAGFVVCPLLFVGAGAVGGIVARSGTRWLYVDLACGLVLAPFMVWAGEQPHRPGDVFGITVLLVFTLAFLAASAAGVIVGRADARRAHAAASLTMWGIFVPAALVLLVSLV